MKTLVAVLMFVGFASMFATGFDTRQEDGNCDCHGQYGLGYCLIERNNRNDLC